ncbi:MAG: Fur family transcriptional regulator [Chloroflexia bacterium]
MAEPATLLTQLKERGYKRTAPRRRLLAEIAGRGAPFTAAEIYAVVQGQPPAVGRATVFRTLDLLAELGLVQRIQETPDATGGPLYLACAPVHHHHLICSGCSSVADFVEADLETLLAGVAERQGFVMQDHRVELYGLCPNCRQAEQ